MLRSSAAFVVAVCYVVVPYRRSLGLCFSPSGRLGRSTGPGAVAKWRMSENGEPEKNLWLHGWWPLPTFRRGRHRCNECEIYTNINTIYSIVYFVRLVAIAGRIFCLCEENILLICWQIYRSTILISYAASTDLYDTVYLFIHACRQQSFVAALDLTDRIFNEFPMTGAPAKHRQRETRH